MNTQFEQVTQEPLQVRLAGLGDLQASYMPFLRRGGLFVSTRRSFHLGQAVTAMLNLPGHIDSMLISAEIAWITPPRAQGNRSCGVGIHFAADEAGTQLRAVLEALLAAPNPISVASYTI